MRVCYTIYRTPENEGRTTMARKTIQMVLIESEGRYCAIVPFENATPLCVFLDAENWEDATRKFDQMLVDVQRQINAAEAIEQAFEGVDLS